MAAMPVTEDSAALVSQCLDFCQTLASKSPTFSFTLTLGGSFSFSLDTRGKEALAFKGKKKKTPSSLRRDARRREQFLKKKLEVSTGDASSQSKNVSAEEAVKEVVEKKDFKCEQCENTFKSENGLKIHIGRAHKIVNSTPSTPERLRQQLEGSVCISASPLLDTSREEFSLNNVAVEEKAKPPPSLRPLPLPPSPHKCPPFHPCSRRECKLRVERQRAKEALHKTCTNCDEDLYITMCCAEDKGLCEDCCNDLGVCS